MKVYSLRSYEEALSEAGLLAASRILDDTLAIEHITYGSKDARPFTLFACKGAAFRAAYLDEAIERGACAYVSERAYDTARPTSCLLVNDIRRAMALIADLHYDKAYDKLILTGITGTKGKSTTAYYIKFILDEYLQEIGERPSGIVSSIDTYDGAGLTPSRLTTPEAFELHRHFDNAVQAGLRFFTMEVSSQALKYHRTLGVEFDTAVFLNISEDHISANEHSDFEDYFSSKLQIFGQARRAVVNLGTDRLPRVLEAAKAAGSLTTFGLREGADVQGFDIRKEGHETRFRVKCRDFDEEFALTMPGLFNVENALAAITVCRGFGIPVHAMRAGLRKARSRGRMEIFTSADGSRAVIVDFAHNKMSFESLFRSVLAEYPGRRIVTVFGCPGDRAVNRRQELGELAGRWSDKVYLTADDPGFESVADISAQIAAHVGGTECVQIEDRVTAIGEAIADAGPNSVVLILGKGSEAYQKVGSQYLPYEPDSHWAQELLRAVGQSDRAGALPHRNGPLGKIN